MREFIRIQRPVAVSALTQMWVGAFRPACVDHDILDRRTGKFPAKCEDLILIGISPGRTPLIADNGQFLLGCRLKLHILLVKPCELVANALETAADTEKRFWRGKGLAGLDGLVPCTKLPIRETAGKNKAVIQTAEFHLPAGIARQLCAPEHSGRAVFDDRKGEISVNRERAQYAKALTFRAAIVPCPFQGELLQRVDPMTPLM